MTAGDETKLNRIADEQLTGECRKCPVQQPGDSDSVINKRLNVP